MHENPRIGALELGGTKSIAIVSSGQSILEQRRFDTTDPASTISALLQSLQQWDKELPLDAIGVASFGPLSLEPKSADYGTILTTPKPGWANAKIIEPLRQWFDCPVGIETDVTAAALAEYEWGAGQNCDSLVYMTIGTGLGGGILIDGIPVRGRLHPEIGHVRLRREACDPFGGICPFHGDCAEGLLSGPALAARFGKAASDVPASDDRWGFASRDLAQLFGMLIYTLAPQKIVIGGGVGLGAPHLVDRAIGHMSEILGGYFPDIGLYELSDLVAPAALGEQAGPMGAVMVGIRACRRENLT